MEGKKGGSEGRKNELVPLELVVTSRNPGWFRNTTSKPVIGKNTVYARNRNVMKYSKPALLKKKLCYFNKYSLRC